MFTEAIAGDILDSALDCEKLKLDVIHEHKLTFKLIFSQTDLHCFEVFYEFIKFYLLGDRRFPFTNRLSKYPLNTLDRARAKAGS